MDVRPWCKDRVLAQQTLGKIGMTIYTLERHVNPMALMPTCADILFAGTIDACTVQGVSTGDLLPGFSAVLGEYLQHTMTSSHSTLCFMCRVLPASLHPLQTSSNACRPPAWMLAYAQSKRCSTSS
jgi:hypothetical protein